MSKKLEVHYTVGGLSALSYYLAGPYNEREKLLEMAETTFRGYHCTSRWLTGVHDLQPPAVCAADDLEDIRRADAMVLYTSKPSTKGGMWVEYGIAIERHMPVAVIIGGGHPINVFCYLGVPSIVTFDDPRVAAEWLGTLTMGVGP